MVNTSLGLHRGWLSDASLSRRKPGWRFTAGTQYVLKSFEDLTTRQAVASDSLTPGDMLKLEIQFFMTHLLVLKKNKELKTKTYFTTA